MLVMYPSPQFSPALLDVILLMQKTLQGILETLLVANRNQNAHSIYLSEISAELHKVNTHLDVPA